MTDNRSPEEDYFTIYSWDDSGGAREKLKQNLLKALITNHYPEHVLEQDFHFVYLLDFLGHHKVHCAIIEHKYFSQSYIEDYHQRFFLGLEGYKRFSKRVHFFKSPPPKEFLKDNSTQKKIFLDFKKNKKLKKFWEDDNYIGNIFLRPLPTGLVGVTILRPYKPSTNRVPERNYPATHNYKINLFGVEKTLESLVYASQDSISGACATAALFSAFYKYSSLFRTPILSPGSITSEGKLFQGEERLFPNKGLTSLQMKSAIQAIGLECEILNDDTILQNPFLINEMIMAFLRGGLPVIFSFGFKDTKDYHAVTICGYSTKDRANKDVKFELVDSDSTLQIRSKKFIKFYAHDDQLGPFSRIYIVGDKITSGWWEDNKHPDVKIDVDFADVMVAYPDVIKISYPQVKRQVLRIHILLLYLRQLSNNKVLQDLSWDIYLTESNEYKQKMQQSKPQKAAEYVIFDCLPKYIWVVKGFSKNDLLFDIIIDSTSVDSEYSPLKLIIYKKSASESLVKMLQDHYNTALIDLKQQLSKGVSLAIPVIKFLDFFHSELKEEKR